MFLTAGAICPPQPDVTTFRCNHMRLKDVPNAVHTDTLDLDLSHNLIEVLHEDSFIRLHRLRRLVLRHNSIYKITDRAFLNEAHSLEILDLRNNRIASNKIILFPTAAFLPLVRLIHLDLSANSIGLLPTGFLRQMGAYLKRLEISASTVAMQIQPGAFSGLARLSHLDLGHNTFIEFRADVLDGLHPELLSYFSLQGVQWNCDCHIRWFQRWLNMVQLKALSSDSHPGGECIAPTEFQGLALVHLNQPGLQCPPSLLDMEPAGSTGNPAEVVQVIGVRGSNLTLQCTFVSETKPQLEWYRNGIRIRPHWKRLQQTTMSNTRPSTSLKFHKLDPQLDSGLYRCEAGNQAGTAKAEFNLSIYSSLPKSLQTINQRSRVSMLSSTKSFVSQDVTIYLLISGIIVASNVAFIIVGAATYHWVKNQWSDTLRSLTTVCCKCSKTFSLPPSPSLLREVPQPDNRTSFPHTIMCGCDTMGENHASIVDTASTLPSHAALALSIIPHNKFHPSSWNDTLRGNTFGSISLVKTMESILTPKHTDRNQGTICYKPTSYYMLTLKNDGKLSPNEMVYIANENVSCEGATTATTNFTPKIGERGCLVVSEKTTLSSSCEYLEYNSALSVASETVSAKVKITCPIHGNDSTERPVGRLNTQAECEIHPRTYVDLSVCPVHGLATCTLSDGEESLSSSVSFCPFTSESRFT
ncbi:unnamed protein product [Dicrocoelium dendriticum]|nr:unnamed protein product [Dicrocoelium dendriticum]